MGFPGYFLIVADFIAWARANGIPVGPGRGSGAGSLVAYALGITDLDPIQHDLLFERFLNPERVSMPDFDVDFCMEGRDRVIDYVAGRYGRDAVSQIITFGTMAAKAVVRDVGRVMGHPYGFVDRVAKMVPFELGMTLEKALTDSDDLKAAYEDDEEVRTLIDMGQKLEGLTRNAGKHAGGVVIAPTKLTDFAPLYCEPGGDNLVTQFDKDDVEAAGLVKFDFLGLRTLTIIDWALKTINARAAAGPSGDQAPVDIDRIDPADPAAFALLKSAETTAVFQLESRGMKELIKKLQPDCFEEITALVALFRPGPLQSGMVDDFINRKHGRAEVAYPHPDLAPILQPTYGVILYQEQVMQIAQVLAGYSLGGADLLRRAMGKKKAEEMAKQRAIFQEGAEGRGVDRAVAAHIFDLMEKFAGYGFNKSHSAAYALVSYQTLWLKAHHPAAFMAAVLSADMDNTDKVVTLIEECRSMGLEVEPPAVNRSEYRFTIADGADRGLWPGGHQGRRRVRHRGDAGGAPRRRPLPGPVGVLSAHRPAKGQSPGAGEHDPRRRPGRPGPQSRHPDGATAAGAQVRRAAPADAGGGPGRSVRRPVRRPGKRLANPPPQTRSSPPSRAMTGTRSSAWPGSARPWGSGSPATPSTATPPRSTPWSAPPTASPASWRPSATPRRPRRAGTASAASATAAASPGWWSACATARPRAGAWAPRCSMTAPGAWRSRSSPNSTSRPATCWSRTN